MTLFCSHVAPSWRALQHLLNILEDGASDTDMMCNVNKTVCIIFLPKDKGSSDISTSMSCKLHRWSPANWTVSVNANIGRCMKRGLPVETCPLTKPDDGWHIVKLTMTITHSDGWKRRRLHQHHCREMRKKWTLHRRDGCCCGIRTTSPDISPRAERVTVRPNETLTRDPVCMTRDPGKHLRNLLQFLETVFLLCRKVTDELVCAWSPHHWSGSKSSRHFKPVKGTDLHRLSTSPISPVAVQFLTLSAALSLTTEISLVWTTGERTMTCDPGDPAKKVTYSTHWLTIRWPIAWSVCPRYLSMAGYKTT